MTMRTGPMTTPTQGMLTDHPEPQVNEEETTWQNSELRSARPGG